MPRKARTFTPEQLTVWIRELIAANNIHAFYICGSWISLRNKALDQQHHECQPCKEKGIYRTATVVHHIKPLRLFPWLALTISNLLALCDSCHYVAHHPHRKKWNDEKW